MDEPHILHCSQCNGANILLVAITMDTRHRVKTTTKHQVSYYNSFCKDRPYSFSAMIYGVSFIEYTTTILLYTLKTSSVVAQTSMVNL